MLTMRIEDKGVGKGLGNVAGNLLSDIEIALDKLANMTKLKMQSEAPKGETGKLGNDIEIRSSKNSREIEPTARNLSGDKFALYVERGTKAGYVPNVGNIEAYFGVDRQTAWAIALKIKEKGTPANNFVERTFDDIEPRIPNIVGDLAKNICMWYQRGA